MGSGEERAGTVGGRVASGLVIVMGIALVAMGISRFPGNGTVAMGAGPDAQGNGGLGAMALVALGAVIVFVGLAMLTSALGAALPKVTDGPVGAAVGETCADCGLLNDAGVRTCEACGRPLA